MKILTLPLFCCLLATIPAPAVIQSPASLTTIVNNSESIVIGQGEWSRAQDGRLAVALRVERFATIANSQPSLDPPFVVDGRTVARPAEGVVRLATNATMENLVKHTSFAADRQRLKAFWRRLVGR